ncbi:MAG TPA: hypothetical protein VEZ19_14965, partial [Rubrobacter sp.]|nr:hypothetical protein [Rubrobacter sp.]
VGDNPERILRKTKETAEVAKKFEPRAPTGYGRRVPAGAGGARRLWDGFVRTPTSRFGLKEP